MQMGHFIFGKNIHAINEERNHDFRKEKGWVYGYLKLGWKKRKEIRYNSLYY